MEDILIEFNKEHEDIKTKLCNITFPNRDSTKISQQVGQTLGITGQTVRNYLSGKITDGFLAIAIYKEIQRLKRLEGK